MKKSSNIVVKQVSIEHGIVELRSDNILVFRPDVATFKEYTMPILEDLLEAFIEITDGVPRPNMCDNRYITGIVSKEEQKYTNAYFEKFATKMGMITHSAPVRILVNSYTRIFKPKVPIRLFKTEEAAVKWLTKV
ncbi:MAG: hypothetical protein MK078_01600 [Crocinitomicaceae bacterium]|nr:hypothetical protein [Crocinitomicaceae bacterium]MCH2232916.1 hypothetical protein [Crocinitomicaceae bacterium]